MAKIQPTTILPYTKTSIAPNKEALVTNTSNALSTEEKAPAESIKNLFGVIHHTAAYVEFKKQANSHHLGSVKNAWANRKLP